MASNDAYGLLLSDDMIFSSRITGTAQALGLALKAVKSVPDLLGQARLHLPSCVVLDLSHPGLRVDELIRELRGICSPMPRLVAYGSHVDVASLKAAREAGCNVVLPRSQFVELLPGKLTDWMKSSS